VFDALGNEPFKISKLIQQVKTKQGSLADCGTEFVKRKAEIVKKTVDLIVLYLSNKKCCCH
jgi:hypothetical protein